MKSFWHLIESVFAAVGAWLGYFLGGSDGLLYALLVFVIVDYITGVMCAIEDRTLSSAVGFRGLCRKVLTFLLVGIQLRRRLPRPLPEGADLPAGGHRPGPG